MKNFILLIFPIAFLSSCKKDYTCTCNVLYPNGQQTKKEQILIDMRKDDAKKVCVDYEETKNGVTTTVTCELK